SGPGAAREAKAVLPSPWASHSRVETSGGSTPPSPRTAEGTSSWAPGGPLPLPRLHPKPELFPPVVLHEQGEGSLGVDHSPRPLHHPELQARGDAPREIRDRVPLVDQDLRSVGNVADLDGRVPTLVVAPRAAGVLPLGD